MNNRRLLTTRNCSPRFLILLFGTFTILSSIVLASRPHVLVIAISLAALVATYFFEPQQRSSFVSGWLSGLVLAILGTERYITLWFGPGNTYESIRRNESSFTRSLGSQYPPAS